MHFTTAAAAAVAAWTISPSLVAASSQHVRSDAEVPSIRSYFYVGGEYVEDGNGGHIFRDQMYVEKLLPVSGATQDTPIVLIHGQAQTGSNFLNKPDGGRGWASQFISQGYEVYIVDQTFRGRSAWMPSYGAKQPSTLSAETIEKAFTATHKFNIWPQAVNHTQWPGTGLRGDPIFDAFYSANVQFIGNTTYQQAAVQAAGAALLDKIGRPVILLGHSQGSFMPLLIADARPTLAKALILLEAGGPPFVDEIFVFGGENPRQWGLTDIPLTYEPAVTDPTVDIVKTRVASKGEGYSDCTLQAADPQPRQLINLLDKPILMVTGEASYHMPYDYCTANYLKQAGCSKTEHVELGDVGIHGNGHMMFMEKNSDGIQAFIERWIQSRLSLYTMDLPKTS
ncbi:AB hydrolase-1 domain-containing protein [Fusarium sp. Ph1]|nr:AB hydrolase-1 domain-containing protein [Fusarium sp. Ph1]